MISIQAATTCARGGTMRRRSPLGFATKLTNHSLWTSAAMATALSSSDPIQVLYQGEDHPGGGPPEHVSLVRGPAVIDTQSGYVIGPGGRVIYDSLYPNGTPHHPLWRIATPSFRQYLSHRVRSQVQSRYPRVVSLRCYWEWNYYHFMLDVLGKLQLLDEAGIDPQTPLVLGRYARELPWVKTFLQRGGLAKRNWVIPDEDYVVADEIVYCRTLRRHMDRTNFVLDEMHIDDLPAGDHRLFLGRGDAQTRSLANRSEIYSMLTKYGFEIRESLTDVAGVASCPVFSKVRYFVGIHGAGMTNILFRRS